MSRRKNSRLACVARLCGHVLFVLTTTEEKENLLAVYYYLKTAYISLLSFNIILSILSY